MTEDKFKWDENNVTELLYHLSKKTNWVHSQMCKWAEDFKQSKLQSQDKQVGWEIVEMTNGKGTWIQEVGPKDNWDMFLSWEGYYINQVRRTSDGEVFSLGDMLSYGAMNIQSGSLATTKEAPILSLNVREDNMVYAEVSDKIFFPITHLHKAKPKPQPSSIERIEPMPETKYMGSFEAYTSGVSYGVNWCKKYGIPKDLSEITSAKTTQPKEEDKPVLFITEDGVEYREGEKKEIWGVHTKDGYNSVGAYHPDVHPEYYEALKAHYDHFFSTKEAAEQYILENKPCLSLNDLLKVWEGYKAFNDGYYKTSPMYKRFEKLAAQKLKQ